MIRVPAFSSDGRSHASPVEPGSEGLISSVPGVTSRPPATPVFEASAPAASASAASVPRAEAIDDDTVLAARRPRALIALRWDDGTHVGVYGRTLFGRNPAPEPDATTIAVRDETLSLSKTHFEIGGGPSGAWLVDRHSTNGTILVRGAVREQLTPGVRTELRAGDRLEFGDRSVEVGASA